MVSPKMDHFPIIQSLSAMVWITFISAVGSLECYQCTTTWDMGCWYKWETTHPPTLERKHLRPCPEEEGGGAITSCVKESFQHKFLNENFHGYSPYVRRRCAGTIERKSRLPDSCTKEEVGIVVGNQTLRVAQTTCYCSTDNCNAGYRLQLPDWHFLASAAPALVVVVTLFPSAFF